MPKILGSRLYPTDEEVLENYRRGILDHTEAMILPLEIEIDDLPVAFQERARELLQQDEENARRQAS